MSEYGTIYSTDDVKRQLIESNRNYNNEQTWKKAISDVNLNASRNQSSLADNYSSAANDAYASYLRNKNSINESGMIGQGKQELQSQNDANLQEAYNSYLKNYYTNAENISSEQSKQLSSIDDALSEQAENVSSYADAHFGYLEDLYNSDQNNTYEEGQSSLFSDPQWSRYLTTENVNGVDTNRLMTKEELMTPTYDTTIDDNGNEVKEWTSIYDDEGNLTTRGIDFFDQIENSIANKGGENTFGNYLSKNNEDLYKWSQSYNPYDYTFEGTNKGTFRTMSGMASTDDDYSFAERFGGFSKKQITNLYDKFNTGLSELDNLNAKDATTKVSEYSSQIFSLAKDLGIDNVLSEQGIDENTLTDKLTELVNMTKTDGDVALEQAMSGVLSAGTGAAAGATVGSVVPGVGTVLGAIIGFFAGTISNVDEQARIRNSANETNEFAKSTSKELYADMLNKMVNLSLQTKRNSEIIKR